MSKIKILHVTFDMAIAGTEQVIRQLVENTDPEKFETSIMCIDGKIGALGNELIKNGVEINTVERGPSGLDFKLVANLRHHIRSNNIDVVHCHQYTPYIYGLFAAIGTSRPVIFTEHGRFYPDSYKWKRILLNPLLSLCTSSIVAISDATAQALVKYENFPRKKIKVIYNGIRKAPVTASTSQHLRQELGINHEANILGTISRLDPIKNQTMMIRSFSQTLSHHQNSYLVIVGDGPERKNLEQLVEQLGIKSQVIFTGFKVNPQRYLEIMDIFLLPSLSEGTSMTLLEAMAYKKPTIVTNAGGNPEIVDNEVTGIVTTNEAEEELSNAMTRLLNDPDLAIRFGINGYERYIDMFTVDKMILQYETLYLDKL